MNFDDKTKRALCICLAIAMVVPVVVGIIYMFAGV